MRYVGMLGLIGFLSCTNTKPKPDDTSIDSDSEEVLDTSNTIDTSDTGDTGDIPDPVPTGCNATLTDEDNIEMNNSWLVGSFEGSFVETGFVIGYSTHPNHVVAQTDSNWLSGAFGELLAEEHQGSFEMSFSEEVSCVQPVIDEMFAARDAAFVSGHFSDANVYCEDLSFELFMCPESDDRLHFTIDLISDSNFTIPTKTSLTLSSTSDERIFGMGEQFAQNSLNLKGRVIPVISQEGGVGRGHPIITPFINQLSSGSGGSEDSTYFAMPHYLTDQYRSLFLTNTEYSEFNFSEDDQIQIVVYSDSIDGEFLFGTTPKDLISTFTEYAGRMPAPPDWVDNGAIIALARPIEESRDIINDMLESGTKIAGIWNQTWSGINRTFIGEQVLWNWEQGEYDHPQWDNFVTEVEEQNINVLCYVNSMFLNVAGHESNPDRNLYQEGIDGEYFVHNEDGEVLEIPVTAFDVALLDLTNPQARTWMKNIIKTEMIQNARCKGWMVDFAEALPFNAILHDGTPASEYHNQYPVEWMKINRQAIEEVGLLAEILTINRAGFTTTPQYSLMTWEGDQLTTWDRHDGFISAIRGLINGGFSGISLNHSDIGGYTSISQLGIGYSRESQLLKRWSEMAAFTSLMRTHEGNQPGSNNQVYSNTQSREHFSRVTSMYTALTEYRRGLFEEAETQGLPVVRHLWLEYPEDVNTFEFDLQFMLGADILVAPNTEKCNLPWCSFEQDVYLPDDIWVHLWTGDIFVGPDTISIESPIGYPAVFYKQSSPSSIDILQAFRENGLDVHPE